MSGISYPDLRDVKENMPNFMINDIEKNTIMLHKNVNNIQKISTIEKFTALRDSSNYRKIDPLFKLGDENHRIILDWALKNPKLLRNVQCTGIQKVSDFLVTRKNKKPYCYKLEKCNSSSCSKVHNASVKDLAEFSENVPIMLAFLFFRPAVRRRLVLPSFARDHFERISRSKCRELDLNWVIKTIRDWSFAPMHETGMGFNPWIFIKSDYSQYYSATNYFLQIFSNILTSDVKFKCNKGNCGSLDCTRVHFNVTQLDRIGSFRWILRLVLNEAKNRFKLYDNCDIETMVLNTTGRFIKDNLSSYSVISQYASLLVLANLELEYHDKILLVMRKFTEFSDESNESKEIEDEPDMIDYSELDSGRLLESCFSALQGTSKSHKLLTVSQYGCSIGEAYMKILLDTFRTHLSKIFDGKLPIGVSRYQVDSILKEEVPYTMAMHLWLFQTASCLEIAAELKSMKVKGFRDVEKGVATVENWKNAAIRECNGKNHKWLTLMKSPLPKDMISACESFIPGWIKALSGLIRKNVPSVTPSRKNEATASLRRWEDEDIPIYLNEDDEMTDWRKIIRFLRNYYLSNSSLSRETQQHLAGTLNYLLHASHHLKHTDYATFDPEFFLFLAYQLFELMEKLCLNEELQYLIASNDEKTPPGSNVTGFVTFGSMSPQDCVEIASQFESCKIKIAKFLPLEGIYLQKWAKETEADELDQCFAALSIEIAAGKSIAKNGMFRNVKCSTTQICK